MVPESAGLVTVGQGSAVTAVVVPVHHITVSCQRVGDVVVSAQVLAHAVHEHDDTGGRLSVIGCPAKTGEPPAVCGLVAERVRSRCHVQNIKMVRPNESSPDFLASGSTTYVWTYVQTYVHIVHRPCHTAESHQHDFVRIHP